MANLSNHVHFAANIPSIVCCSIELNEHNVIISLQTKIRSLMGLSCLETTKSFTAELKEINLGCCAGIIGSAGKSGVFFNFTFLVLVLVYLEGVRFSHCAIYRRIRRT